MNEYSFVTIRAWTKNFPHKGSLIIAQWTVLTIVRVFLQRNVFEVGYVYEHVTPEIWSNHFTNELQAMY